MALIRNGACSTRLVLSPILGLLIVSPGSAQTSATAPPAAALNPAMHFVEQLKAKWAGRSPEELRKAAEAGDPEAEYCLGASEWDAGLADNSNAWPPQAIAQARSLSQIERSTSSNRWSTVAESELRQAAESGDRGAQYILNQRQAARSFASADAHGRRAFGWLEKSAAASFAPAQYDVAMRYLGRIGWNIIPFDTARGLQWLQRSADLNWEPAQHALADFCQAGEFIPPDPRKMIDMLQRAAAQGCARAQYDLARHLEQGEGEPSGPDESPLALLKKSARQGYQPAFRLLAEHYRTGLGSQQDYLRAIRYYQRGRETITENGFLSQTRFSGIFGLLKLDLEPQWPLDRDLVPFAQILSTYLKATEQTNAPAMTQLGQYYLEGRFMPQNKVDALRWFNRAAAQGDSAAVPLRDRLQATLSPGELQQAASTPSSESADWP